MRLKYGTCGHLSQLQIVNNVVGPLMVVRRKSTSGRGRHEPRIAEAVAMIRREACEGLTVAALAARFSGSLWLETPGDYAFHLASDDAAALWIDGVAVILDDAPHSYRTRSAIVMLSAGLH